MGESQPNEFLRREGARPSISYHGVCFDITINVCVLHFIPWYPKTIPDNTSGCQALGARRYQVMPIFQILGTVGACLWPRSAKGHWMRSAIKCLWPILVIIGCVCDGVRVHSAERFGKEDLHPHRRPPAVCAQSPLCVIILFSSDTLRMISLSEWIGTSYTSFICWLQFRGC